MSRHAVRLEVIPTFKPGDPPPVGYVAWCEWADVQRAAGLRQQRCAQCALWRFPQEACAHSTLSRGELRATDKEEP